MLEYGLMTLDSRRLTVVVTGVANLLGTNAASVAVKTVRLWAGLPGSSPYGSISVREKNKTANLVVTVLYVIGSCVSARLSGLLF